MNLNQYLELISAFSKRADVAQYLVGITANVASRKAAYKNVSFDYFEVFSSGHTRDEAIALERAIFEKATTDSSLREKYHWEKRDKPYRASTGGKRGETYSIYVAGFDPKNLS